MQDFRRVKIDWIAGYDAAPSSRIWKYGRYQPFKPFDLWTKHITTDYTQMHKWTPKNFSENLFSFRELLSLARIHVPLHLLAILSPNGQSQHWCAIGGMSSGTLEPHLYRELHDTMTTHVDSMTKGIRASGLEWIQFAKLTRKPKQVRSVLYISAKRGKSSDPDRLFLFVFYLGQQICMMLIDCGQDEHLVPLAFRAPEIFHRIFNFSRVLEFAPKLVSCFENSTQNDTPITVITCILSFLPTECFYADWDPDYVGLFKDIGNA